MEVNNSLPTGALLKGSSYSYRIEKTLGQGSFGITYLASVKMAGALGAIDANIKVAIKEFFMRDINGRSDTTVTSGSKGGIYDDYKRKFTREAINLSKLQHPNIIKVIESFEANNTVYYVMEYIGGGSLDDYITKNNGLKEDEAIKIVKQIGSALSFMHENKMLHLDLKPSNIMRKEFGDVVLIDFGLSKQYDKNGEPESSTKVGAGTPGYAPIEQANYREGKGFPVTMDVYALGATMFKILTGVRPPEASDILNDGFPLYELQERNISERSSASIAKAMAPLKKDRYDSVTRFVDSFEDETTIIGDVVVSTNKKTISQTSNMGSYKILPSTQKIEITFNPPFPGKGEYYKASIKTDEMLIAGVVNSEPRKQSWSFDNKSFSMFLTSLSELNFQVREYDVLEEGLEASEDPAKLSIVLYDDKNSIYAKYWISGWNNQFGNIIGDTLTLNEKVKSIIPHFDEFLNSSIIKENIEKKGDRVPPHGHNGIGVPPRYRFYKIGAALLFVFVLFVIASKNVLPWPWSNKDDVIDTLQTRTDTIKENIMQHDDISTLDDNSPLNEHQEVREPNVSQSKPPNDGSEHGQNANNTNDDEVRYQKAVSSNNQMVIKELAANGFAKAYSKAANIYLKEGEYFNADSYARRALNSGYGRKEAINVIEILDGYGYYDNGEHGGKPKY